MPLLTCLCGHEAAACAANGPAAAAAAGARVSVVVDAHEPLQQLARSAARFDTSVDVLVEVNVGQDR